MAIYQKKTLHLQKKIMEHEKLRVFLTVYFIKMSVKIINDALDMKHLKTKNCNLIAHTVIQIINISLIKDYGSRELCHNVLFSTKTLNKDLFSFKCYN